MVEAGLGAIASMVQVTVSVSGETNGHGHNGDGESEDEGEDSGECLNCAFVFGVCVVLVFVMWSVVGEWVHSHLF